MTQTKHPALSSLAPLYPPAGRFAYVGKALLGVEGGLANNRFDAGGITNHGISLRFLKAEGQLDLDGDGHADFDLDFDGDIDGQDIRLLTTQQALNLFYFCIWQHFDFGGLPTHIDSAVFDQAVNGGVAAAVKMMQTCLNAMDLPCAVLKIDGVMGNQTRACASASIRQPGGLDAFLTRYRAAAEARYRAIVAAKPSQAEFLDGWIVRARRLGNV